MKISQISQINLSQVVFAICAGLIAGSIVVLSRFYTADEPSLVYAFVVTLATSVVVKVMLEAKPKSEESSPVYEGRKPKQGSILRYRFQFYPNENCAAIHIDRKVSKESQYFGEGRYSFSHDDKKPSAWVQQLLNLDGVETISLQVHEISLTKGEAYSWDEILGPALQIVKIEFANTAELIKVAEDKHPSPAELRELARADRDFTY